MRKPKMTKKSGRKIPVQVTSRTKKPKKIGSAKGQPWTKKDELLLRQKYGSIPIEELARRLGRTVASLRAKIRRLRLRGRTAEVANRRRQVGSKGLSKKALVRRKKTPVAKKAAKKASKKKKPSPDTDDPGPRKRG